MIYLGSAAILLLFALAIWEIVKASVTVKEIEAENARTQRWLDGLKAGRSADTVRPERSDPERTSL